MKLHSILLIISLFLFSCSSDPCEGINCVNGFCVDGTCQCDEGYAGTLCDELPCANGTYENGKCQCPEGFYGTLCDTEDLTSVFVMTKLLIKDCPSYDPQYDLSGTPDDVELCGLNASQREVCFNYNYTIFNERQLFRAEVIKVDNNGEFELTRNSILQGTYTALNDELFINYVDGSSEVLIISNDKLINSQHLSDGGSPDCTLLQEFSYTFDL